MNISNLEKFELTELIKLNSVNMSADIKSLANKLREERYGKKVFLRGLIEFSNHCKNDCFYCGIRRGNTAITRYRLDKKTILNLCESAYNCGLRTFVLQSGEDMYYTDAIMCGIISSIREKYPDCAITLSMGEKSKDTYKAYFSAGANRYLLRHETANSEHYSKLHPHELSLKTRKKCLYDLKEIGFQVGAGFMVGSPYQDFECLADDILFLRELQPHMVGIGPFLPHCESKFKDFPSGELNLTLLMVALARITLPSTLIPATTAISTLHPQGREMALACGANVVMPIFTPQENKADYLLYDNKICAGENAEDSIFHLTQRIEATGYEVDMSRGDAKNFCNY